MKPDNLSTGAAAPSSFAAADLSAGVGFDLLGEALGQAVESALEEALAGGAVFAVGDDPLTIFRATLEASICSIEGDPRGRLFRRFLRDGPCEGERGTATEPHGQALTADETAKTIHFIDSFMVSAFKGAVTELLAAAACLRLMRDPRLGLPAGARLYVGDTVMVPRKSGKGQLKAADLHVLLINEKPEAPSVTVAGVVEVKSGRVSAHAMERQIEQHIRRARQALRISGMDYPGGTIRIGHGPAARILRITVQPSNWLLPRTLRFECVGENRQLVLDPAISPWDGDQFIPMGDDRWHIALRWSMEAITAAAYEMTFWFMEKVGESLFTQENGQPSPLPPEWADMDAAEAGRNAVKMMLYDTILHYPGKRDESNPLTRKEAHVLNRAIALYNCYGFGYALGMNFRNKEGRREMLWPQDLDEIAEKGCTEAECRIR
ncbi:MAG: hypothetical protein NTV46_03340 [Verrucomicrobia bacterium]|nr:hypothetical protein [Verrucomicrobiota bacterium]